MFMQKPQGMAELLPGISNISTTRSLSRAHLMKDHATLVRWDIRILGINPAEVHCGFRLRTSIALASNLL